MNERNADVTVIIRVVVVQDDQLAKECERLAARCADLEAEKYALECELAKKRCPDCGRLRDEW